MMWHTAIDEQRQALCGEPVVLGHRRPAESGKSRVYLGIWRE